MIPVLTEKAITTKENKTSDDTRTETTNSSQGPSTCPLTPLHTIHGPTRQRNPPPSHPPSSSRPPRTHKPTWTYHPSRSTFPTSNPTGPDSPLTQRPGGHLTPPHPLGRDGTGRPPCLISSAKFQGPPSQCGSAHTG